MEMKWICLGMLGGLLGSVGVGAYAGTARAAEPERAASSELEAALLDADRRFVAGDLEGALGVLSPACAASDRPDCAFSLGAIEHGLGHCVQALGHYRKYRELAPQGEHIAEVAAALEEVESRCGDASATPAGAAPLASGAPSGGVSAQAVPAVPALSAVSSPREPAVPAELWTTPASPQPHTELMLGSFVLSGAAAVGSVVFGILAAQSAHDCTQPRVYDRKFIEQCEEQGPSYQALWQGLAVASGGFLGIGLTLWWIDAEAASSDGVAAAGYPALKYQGRF
jgi:hypothetical protein